MRMMSRASYYYEVPANLKAILALLYPLDVEQMPETYQDCLHWLHDTGCGGHL